MKKKDSEQRTPDTDPQENQDDSSIGMLWNMSGSVLRNVRDLARSRLDMMSDWLRDIALNKVAVATYNDIIEYFVDERPDNTSVEKGALLLQKTKQGILLTQLFLNAANQPVCKPDGTAYGRKLLATSLDNDLREAFGENSIIIFD